MDGASVGGVGAAVGDCEGAVGTAEGLSDGTLVGFCTGNHVGEDAKNKICEIGSKNY